MAVLLNETETLRVDEVLSLMRFTGVGVEDWAQAQVTITSRTVVTRHGEAWNVAEDEVKAVMS